MKTQIRILTLCVLGLSTSANYATAQEVIRCDFKTGSSGSWLSEWVLIHTDKSGAHVFDASTWTAAKGALPARKLKPKPKGQRYQWSVKLRIRGETAHIKYLLTVSNDPEMISTIAANISTRRIRTQFARGKCQKLTPTSKADFLSWAKEEVAKG